MDPYVIRSATPEDAEKLLQVYAPYVETTSVTFEYEIPTAEDFSGRIRNTLTRYPYLVIEKDGTLLGYAYAGSFHTRAAYSWCCEMSIYVAREARGLGLGRRLYEELEQALARMGITNLYACIAVPHEKEDEYLTFNSRDFHAHLGYQLCGTFHHCGYKFNRWYDMIWMEKIIGTHVSNQPPVVNYNECRGDAK